MTQGKTDLSAYDNSWYKPGGGFKRAIWYFVNVIFFKSSWFPFYGLKVSLLRMFGAQVGKGVLIKPNVNIKYPWKLRIGDHVWIGENVWIDNLAEVSIGNNVCISQQAYLLCGNHDYSKATFDLIVAAINIEEGAWIGARGIVTGGSICRSHSVLTSNSVCSGTLDAYGIYRGNPAEKVRERKIG